MKRPVLSLSILLLSILPLRSQLVFADEHDHDGHGHGHEEGRHGEDEHGHHDEEGGLKISPEALAASGVSFKTAGPGTIRESLTLNGRIFPNQDKLAHIVPRFAGLVKEVRRKVGDHVDKGEVLAVVESNQSLQPYQIASLVSGEIIERHATLGEFASENQSMFVVADLSELWAELYLFTPDFEKVSIGQKLMLRTVGDSAELPATIAYISTVVDAPTQSRFIRAILPNSSRALFPGQFISGRVVLSELPLPLVIDSKSLQNIEGKPTVFVKEHDGLQPKTVTLGANDGVSTQILSGLEPGAEYATGNTFALKAELGKSEAAHEH